MGPPTKLTAEVRDQIVAEYLAGVSVRVVADSAGVAPGTVYNLLRKRGVALRSHALPFDEAVVEDYVAGVPVLRIGEQHGISASSVYRHLRAANVAKRGQPAVRRKRRT